MSESEDETFESLVSSKKRKHGSSEAASLKSGRSGGAASLKSGRSGASALSGKLPSSINKWVSTERTGW